MNAKTCDDNTNNNANNAQVLAQRAIGVLEGMREDVIKSVIGTGFEGSAEAVFAEVKLAIHANALKDVYPFFKGMRPDFVEGRQFLLTFKPWVHQTATLKAHDAIMVREGKLSPLRPIPVAVQGQAVATVLSVCEKVLRRRAMWWRGKVAGRKGNAEERRRTKDGRKARSGSKCPAVRELRPDEIDQVMDAVKVRAFAKARAQGFAGPLHEGIRNYCLSVIPRAQVDCFEGSRKQPLLVSVRNLEQISDKLDNIPTPAQRPEGDNDAEELVAVAEGHLIHSRFEKSGRESRSEEFQPAVGNTEPLLGGDDNSSDGDEEPDPFESEGYEGPGDGEVSGGSEEVEAEMTSGPVDPRGETDGTASRDRVAGPEAKDQGTWLKLIRSAGFMHHVATNAVASEIGVPRWKFGKARAERSFRVDLVAEMNRLFSFFYVVAASEDQAVPLRAVAQRLVALGRTAMGRDFFVWACCCAVRSMDKAAAAKVAGRDRGVFASNVTKVGKDIAGILRRYGLQPPEGWPGGKVPQASPTTEG